jgi:hypothetical protein
MGCRLAGATPRNLPRNRLDGQRPCRRERTTDSSCTPNNDTFNDHPRDSNGADLACAFYGRRLRSLSFPGKSLCCNWLCCVRGVAVLRFRCGLSLALFALRPNRACLAGRTRAVAPGQAQVAVGAAAAHERLAEVESVGAAPHGDR